MPRHKTQFGKTSSVLLKLGKLKKKKAVQLVINLQTVRMQIHATTYTRLHDYICVVGSHSLAVYEKFRSSFGTHETTAYKFSLHRRLCQGKSENSGNKKVQFLAGTYQDIKVSFSTIIVLCFGDIFLQ